MAVMGGDYYYQLLIGQEANSRSGSSLSRSEEFVLRAMKVQSDYSFSRYFLSN